MWGNQIRILARFKIKDQSVNNTTAHIQSDKVVKQGTGKIQSSDIGLYYMLMIQTLETTDGKKSQLITTELITEKHSMLT